MLVLTPAATAAVRALLDSPTVPDDAGMRLALGQAPGGEPAIGVTLVTEPEPDDQVIDAGGAEIYVEPEASDLLSDQALDAQIDDEKVSFTLRPQSLNGEPPHDPLT